MLTINFGAEACLCRRPRTEDSAGKAENPKRRVSKWQAHMCNCQGPYQPQASWNTGRSSYGTVRAQTRRLETQKPVPHGKINRTEHLLTLSGHERRCVGFQCMNSSGIRIYAMRLRVKGSENLPLRSVGCRAPVFSPAAPNHYVYHDALSEII